MKVLYFKVNLSIYCHESFHRRQSTPFYPHLFPWFFFPMNNSKRRAPKVVATYNGINRMNTRLRYRLFWLWEMVSLYQGWWTWKKFIKWKLFASNTYFVQSMKNFLHNFIFHENNEIWSYLSSSYIKCNFFEI